MYIQLKRSIKYTDSKNWFFSFEKEDFGGNVEYRKLNDLPGKSDYLKIECLTFVLHPRNKSESNFLPGFIKHLTNLRSLTIPIDWLNKIELPASLLALNLTSPVLNHDDQQELPGDLNFNCLKYLAIPELVKSYKINTQRFDSLEWIEYDLQAEKNDNILLELTKLKKLKHLVFNHGKNFDVFTPFRSHSIETLELFACTGKKFPVENIIHLKNLKSLYINNIAVPFDCNLLLELPQLEELFFLNVKNIKNIEQILIHRKINIVSVKFCNNPFKNIGKNKFLEKGFSSLSIDYA